MSMPNVNKVVCADKPQRIIIVSVKKLSTLPAQCQTADTIHLNRTERSTAQEPEMFFSSCWRPNQS